jgi:hypothetical protein
MALKTIKLGGDANMAGLAKLALIIHWYIMATVVFGCVASYTFIQAEILGADSLIHGFITLME